MVTRYRIGVGGTMLDAVNKNICIEDIQYSEPEISMNVETPGLMDGGIITKRYRQKASVTVIFSLNIYDVVARTAAMDKIKSWAMAGGKLVTNDRADQALLDCVCEKFPEVTSVKHWTQPISMTFSAYRFPYWQDNEMVTSYVEGMNGTGNASGKLYIPGNAGKTYVSVDVMPTAANITWFEVICGDTSIRVDAKINKNSLVTIDYDDRMNLRIMNGTTSLLGSRKATSSDLLLGKTGVNNTVKIKASAKTGATFYAKGAWL